MTKKFNDNSLSVGLSSRMTTSISNAQRTSYRLALFYSLMISVLAGIMADPTRLHEWMMLADQGMYITAARQFLDNSTIEMTCEPLSIFEAGKRHFYYMPGYTVMLAVVYYIFGYGILQSTLLTAILFILSCMLCYHIGVILYGSFTGWTAMILYSCYPFLQLFTFTAMSEMSIIFIFLLSFAIFLHVNQRWQLLLGIALALLTVLFRETSAVVVISMCAMLLNRRLLDYRWKSVCYLLFTSVIAITILYTSPLSTSRISTFYSMIVYEYDPELMENQPLGSQSKPLRVVFFQKLLHRAVNNTLQLLRSCTLDLRGLEWLFILMAIPLGLWHFLHRRDYFMLSVSLAIVLTLIAIVSFHVVGHIGKRHMLQLLPFVCIVYARTAAMCIRARWHTYTIICLILIILPLSLNVIYRDWNYYHLFDTYNDAMLAELEAIHHDDSTAMMAPFQAATSYSIKHYPVKVFPIAYSRTTLENMLQRKSITTILIPVPVHGGIANETILTNDDLKTMGFSYVCTIKTTYYHYNVFRRN